MEKEFNDIFDDLKEDIDISSSYTLNDLWVKNELKNWVLDLNPNLNKLDISNTKSVKINQNKTKNFDSFLGRKKLKKIDISSNLTFVQKVILWIKWKATISWKLIGTFNKRVYFTKRFLKITSIGLIAILISFSLLSFLVEYKTKAGYEKILLLKEKVWSIEWMQNTINSSKLDFITADILFTPFKIIPNKNIRNWYFILEWGKNISILLDELIQTYIWVDKFINESGWIENIQITNLLVNLKDDFDRLNSLLYNVVLSYESIWKLWIEKLDNKILTARNKVKDLYLFSNTLNKDYNSLLSILWHNEERKYLVLFQNNDEIRATGWFIWSLWIVTVKNGEIIDFKKDDVYAYEWDINKVYKEKSVAPEWLNKITWTFWLRDANYFIDYDSSSRSINFFLKKIWKDVDWIVYVNQNTFLDFLDLTWPIFFDKIWDSIGKDNFSLVISTLVEAQSFKVWTLWTPKKVLFDFAQIFVSKLLSDKNYTSYIDIILKNFKSRDIVFYSFNPEENNLLWKLWVNWAINYNKTLDYSYPVYTSIWWNKSDRYMKLKYEKDIEYNADCSISTNLKILRTHYFSKFEEKKVNDILDRYPIKDKTRKDILNIQWKWENKSYVRVVLPKEIKVEKQDGMNISYNEENTVVDFYINTRLLETTNYNIDYRITNSKCKNYDFVLYKQAWIKDYSVKIKNKNQIIKYDNIKTDFIIKK